MGVPSILLVEDSPGYARLISLLLDEELPDGADVRVVERLADALDAGPADCVLLDLSLPDCDGVVGVTRLREGGVEAPIVVLSGHPDLAVQTAALEAGAAAFVSKDADISVVAAAVCAALSPSPRSS